MKTNWLKFHNLFKAKVRFVTKEKLYTTFSDKNGKFELIIPNEIVKDFNVIYFSFADINKSLKDQQYKYSLDNKSLFLSKKN